MAHSQIESCIVRLLTRDRSNALFLNGDSLLSDEFHCVTSSFVGFRESGNKRDQLYRVCAEVQ